MTRREAATDVVLAVVLVLALALVAGTSVTRLSATVLPPLLSLAIVQGAIVLSVVGGLLAWRGSSWRSIGLLPVDVSDGGRSTLALLAALAAVLAFNSLVLLAAPSAMQTHADRLSLVAGLLTADLSWTALIGATLLIAFYEEVIARGLLLQRCRQLLGGHWPPILVSSLLFGLGHAYQGWTGVLQTMLIGILFARLVLRWGTLWPVIFAHAALNGISLAVLRMVG